MPEFGQYIQKCSELKTSLSGIFVYIVQTRRFNYDFDLLKQYQPIHILYGSLLM